MILAAKFVEGAWITIVVMPLVLALLKLIRRYYDQLHRQLLKEGVLNLSDAAPPVVVSRSASGTGSQNARCGLQCGFRQT